MLIILGSPNVWANNNGANEGQAISMDFDQVDIRVFIKFISELTGKNFIVDDRVKGRITVISPSGISVAEAYKVFESVLEVNGFATVPSGDVIKIVPSVEARRKSVETSTDMKETYSFDDSFVTQVIRLDNADVKNIKKVIIPMVSKTGLVVDYAPTQTLIITDNMSNLQRLVRIIRKLDVPSKEAKISVIDLENAEAEELAQDLSKLFAMLNKQEQQKNPNQPPFVLIPENRLNLLIVLADAKLTKKFKNLIQELDKPTPQGQGNIQVVKLNNAVAEDLAQVLSGLAGAKVGDKKKEKKAIISKEARIVADKATNSLVITASPDEYKVLEDIINQLDQRRKQVFIEAAILEVSFEESFSFGIDWFSGSNIGDDDNIVFGKINNPNLIDDQGNIDITSNSLASTMGTPSAFSLGLLSFPFEFDGKTFYSLGQFIQASQTKNQVNIISTPQIMTLENEEASVVVAENRPFTTSLESSADTDRDYTNYEYKDVGVTLKVTPQINEQGSVKLNLYQEVSRIDQVFQESNIQLPTTKKRTAETKVEINDGQTLAIAGLIEERENTNISGVPFLMDFPILGNIFKTKQKSNPKKNLMVFITPYVVSTVKDGQQLYFDKSEHIQNLRYGLDGKAQPISKDFVPSPATGLNN